MYDGLIQNTHLVATIIFALAVLYLVLGLAQPAWAGAPGRGTVVLRSMLAVLLAVGLAIGVIAYTHMQPDGPHSFDSYMKDFNPEQLQSEKPDVQPAPPAP
jgi:hypothetical protein